MPKLVPNTQTGSLTDHQHGTDDTLILGAGSGPSDPQISLFGDAFAMFDNSRGGNDTLIGGANANNALTGDARFMVDNARGGNDTLTAADGP